MCRGGAFKSAFLPSDCLLSIDFTVGIWLNLLFGIVEFVKGSTRRWTLAIEAPPIQPLQVIQIN